MIVNAKLLSKLVRIVITSDMKLVEEYTAFRKEETRVIGRLAATSRVAEEMKLSASVIVKFMHADKNGMMIEREVDMCQDDETRPV